MAAPKNYLFVHQNFPGQFPHLARALAERGDKVVGIGEGRWLRRRENPHPNIHRIGYTSPGGASASTHPYLAGFEAHVRRGREVFQVARVLAAKGLVPDVVIAHPGWGEALFLRDVFPHARHVHYLEFFYRADGADVGFDPAFPVTLNDRCRIRIKNATQMLGFEAADAGISPTAWQRSRYPSDWQPRIAQLHDGIDTDRVRPDPDVVLRLQRGAADQGIDVISPADQAGDLVLTRSDEILTYVARNLEPYRGFHILMRAIPGILAQRPRARILIVGGDDVSYGSGAGAGRTWRETCQAQWDSTVDRSRVHFLGRIPYGVYLEVLQLSSLHVYLTYPFVLSWSLLEAMSAGCLVLGSATAPVQEVIRDGVNGFLTDFFDAETLASRSAELCARRDEFQGVRSAARETVVNQYDLKRECLPKMLAFVADEH